MSEIAGVIYRVPTGEPLTIPKRHLACFGVTRDSGKTTFIEAAVAQSGLKAVTFKTKRGEIGFEEASPLPLFFDERGLTHWKALEGLIAATLEEKVSREPGIRYGIITVCSRPKQAQSLAEVHARVKEKLKDPKLKEFVREVFTKLDAYLDEVLPQIDRLRGRFTDQLKLPGPGVYVEDLEGLSDELQSLFLASLMRKVYEEESGVIVVLPEVWKFLPQDRGSPVKWVIEKYVREMGAVEGWLWIDAQDLRGVDKKHLRSIDVRLFGRQPDPHEIDDVMKALPLPKAKKPKPEEIMTLKLGHFYAKLRDEVELVYVRPIWLPESVAVRVAKGELAPDCEEVQGYKPKKMEEEELWKEKYEELKKTWDEREAKLTDLLKTAKEKEKADEYLKLLAKDLETVKAENKLLREASGKAVEELERARGETEDLRAFVESLRKLLGPQGGAQSSSLSLMAEELQVKVQATTRTVEVDASKGFNGKILQVMLTDLKDSEWVTTVDVAKALAERGWQRSKDSVRLDFIGLVKEGLVVKEGTKYRLPRQIKFIGGEG